MSAASTGILSNDSLATATDPLYSLSIKWQPILSAIQKLFKHNLCKFSLFFFSKNFVFKMNKYPYYIFFINFIKFTTTCLSFDLLMFWFCRILIYHFWNSENAKSRNKNLPMQFLFTWIYIWVLYFTFKCSICSINTR